MSRRALWSGVLIGLLVASTGALAQRGGARRRPPQKGAVCGDPTVRCPTSYDFKPNDLPFRIPARAVIWESESFYAVILKSVRAAAEDCQQFVSEADRIQAQGLFPHNKVFTERGCGEPGEPYYTNTRADARFMAVYAGRTRAEADKVLAQVQATGKFPGANLRRMSIGFNGT
ncbi:MAG TPA: hypothetical protein VF525_17105 [Pyrinomonadaceae bacterium]|jgi:hypothetical protein